jgi:hypothetical protein
MLTEVGSVVRWSRVLHPPPLPADDEPVPGEISEHQARAVGHRLGI